jgi:hypothetical protein
LRGELSQSIPQRPDRCRVGHPGSARKGYLDPLIQIRASPVTPAPKPGGRPAKVPRREIVNAILYVLENGIKWRAMPRHATGAIRLSKRLGDG